ncbi:hypothetical protein B0H19DRAFT_1067688 [Mycena capillaripes]|nr:hypothetical protein B0H19DRAFT_1067688 [Mycena capillaripes]
MNSTVKPAALRNAKKPHAALSFIYRKGSRKPDNGEIPDRDDVHKRSGVCQARRMMSAGKDAHASRWMPRSSEIVGSWVRGHSAFCVEDFKIYALAWYFGRGMFGDRRGLSLWEKCFKLDAMEFYPTKHAPFPSPEIAFNGVQDVLWLKFGVSNFESYFTKQETRKRRWRCIFVAAECNGFSYNFLRPKVWPKPMNSAAVSAGSNPTASAGRERQMKPIVSASTQLASTKTIRMSENFGFGNILDVAECYSFRCVLSRVFLQPKLSVSATLSAGLKIHIIWCVYDRIRTEAAGGISGAHSTDTVPLDAQFKRCPEKRRRRVIQTWATLSSKFIVMFSSGNPDGGHESTGDGGDWR